MTPNLGESLDRALSFARAQAHRVVLLEHLLLALTEDPEASAVLRTCNVDLDRLGTDASVYLGRLLEDMRADNGAEPRADPELLKVLQAAGQAAQQSKRRQIDGAIVLAAVVGDGKSPAAGLLKAHGLTFEEAIRALQKAKAQARSKQFATPPASAAPAEEPAVAGAAERQEHARVGDSANAPPPAAEPQGTGQTVDEILAAARTRIQKRTAASAGRSGGKASAAAPASSQPQPLPLSSLATLTAPPSVQPPEPDPALAELSVAPPPAPQPAPSPRGNPVAAAPGPGPNRPPGLMARMPQPGPQSGPQPAPPPMPQHAASPPRAPSRQGPVSGAPVVPGLPASRSGRAPWPDPAEPASPPRPVAANGALAGGRRPGTDPGTHPGTHAGTLPPRHGPGRQGRPGPRAGGQAAPGPLVEAIPRRMRMGVPATAQVRISRDKVDGLILLLLNGRGIAHRPDGFLTRALSVRLRAPDGGFWVEPESPETQWVTAGSQQQDDYVSWDWTVTPQWRGKGRLLLLVTARTVGRDGIAAETAPPDRVIEVTVKGSPLRRIGRLAGFAATVAFGAMLGRFGHELWAVAAAVVKRIAG